MAEAGAEQASLELHSLPSEPDCFGSTVTSYSEGSAAMDMCVKTELDEEDISQPAYCTEVQGFSAEEMDSGLHLDTEHIKTEIVMVNIKEDNAELQLCGNSKESCLPSEQLNSSTGLLTKQYKLEIEEVKVEQHFQSEGSSNSEAVVNEAVDGLLQNNSMELESSLIIVRDDIQTKGAFEQPVGPVTGHITDEAGEQSCYDSMAHIAQPWQCLQCREVYTSQSHLKNPLQFRSAERYSCRHCGISFYENCCLKQHEVVHCTKKPYKCSQCGKNFSRQSALKLHHHFHTGEKPYASGNHTDEIKKVKRKRVAHSLKVKLEVLKRIECGERQTDISIALGISKSTVNSIYVSRDQIKARAQNVLGADKLTKVTRGRHEIYEKLERLLVQWIDSYGDQGIPLSAMLIKEKARTLFVDLKNKAMREGDETVTNIKFKGSHGWFERFKKRAMLHNMKIRGEVASAESAGTFPTEFQQIIEEGNYTSKQIFNMDETGLFWKRMPTRSLISKIEARQRGHKASKDRLTLLLGGNLEGDVKLKPLLVYHSENPRALKGVVKDTLPVIWRSNRKAWVTRNVFKDYVKRYFCPFVKEYCAKNNLDNKVILVLDNAPGHPFHVEVYGNVRVVFLPPNTTSLLQPMDQGVISTFKAHYLQIFMEHIASQTDASVTAMDVWKNFTIMQAIGAIVMAWSMVSKQIMNSAWKNLCPKYVQNCRGFEDDLKCIRKEIVLLALKAGFEEVDDENVSEVLASHNEILSNEELLQLDEERLPEERSDDDSEQKDWDVKSLRMLFQHHDAMLQVIDEYETDMERGFKVKMMLTQSMEAYRNLYEDRRKRAKRSSIDGFFMPVEKAATVVPSTSGYVRQSKKTADNVKAVDTDEVDFPDYPISVRSIHRSPVSHPSSSY